MTKIIQRRDPELTADGDWWKRFRVASADVLAAAFLPSTEKARNELDPLLVCDDFVKLSALLPQFHPSLVFSIDECGFCKRFEKDHHRKAALLKRCAAKPTWTEKQETRHFSLRR
jgi:hypothetical protein